MRFVLGQVPSKRDVGATATLANSWTQAAGSRGARAINRVSRARAEADQPWPGARYGYRAVGSTPIRVRRPAAHAVREVRGQAPPNPRGTRNAALVLSKSSTTVLGRLPLLLSCRPIYAAISRRLPVPSTAIHGAHVRLAVSLLATSEIRKDMHCGALGQDKHPLRAHSDLPDAITSASSFQPSSGVAGVADDLGQEEWRGRSRRTRFLLVRSFGDGAQLPREWAGPTRSACDPQSRAAVPPFFRRPAPSLPSTRASLRLCILEQDSLQAWNTRAFTGTRTPPPARTCPPCRARRP